MLYGILSTLFVLLCFLMILIILLQKSKGSLGVIGSAGSGAQMLFGGSGGQDLFQKITWTFVFLFLGGSLLLALMKNKSVHESKYAQVVTTVQAPEAAPVASADAKPFAEDSGLKAADKPAATESSAPAQPAA